MRKTLFERLQPDVKQRLIKNQMTYEFTVTKIIAALDSKHFWNELTIAEVSNLIILATQVCQTGSTLSATSH